VNLSYVEYAGFHQEILKNREPGKNMIDDDAQKVQPKLKDVALRAGVSPTTASMVFTGTGRISDITKAKVLDTAVVMGYQHQQRGRKTLKSGVHVALLILIDKEWSFIWHFLTDMIGQIEQDLGQIGLKAVMIPISHYEDEEVIYQKITKLGCRSVFSIHLGKEKLFKRLEDEGIPVIVIMNNNYQDSYFSICVDDFQGAYEGARHLLNLGHRRIDFVDSYRKDLPILSTDRYYGYRKALEEAGVQFNDDHRINCSVESSEKEIEQCFIESLKRPDPPTALFCLDDEIAFRVWNALTRLGYSVPGDISIIAPGDVLDYSKPYIPPITTMHIDMKYVGRLSVEMLNNRMKNDIDTVHVLKVKQQLMERGSCRAV
jgi:DNA-binding LacI/PurR family transcriptional regulator